MKVILILAVMLQTQKKPCSVRGFGVEKALEHPVAMKVASKESYYQWKRLNIQMQIELP